ncbi:MAG: hypothetical protein ACFWUL_10430 [Dialister sp.]
MTRFPTGVNMPYDSKGKNRYSFDQSRNLSRGREYRSFQPLSFPSQQMHPLVEIEIEVEIEAEGASLRRFHHHLSAPWAALFGEESLLQSHFHVLGIESSGLQQRRSRGTSTLNSQISNLSFYRRLTIFPESQQPAAGSSIRSYTSPCTNKKSSGTARSNSPAALRFSPEMVILLSKSIY